MRLMRVLSAGVLVIACDGEPRLSGQSASTKTVFEGVTVIPMDRQRLLSDHVVVVDGDRITNIGPRGRVSVPAGALRVDGRGKFLIPALVEMHAHLPVEATAAAEVERILSLYVANGIASVRTLRGSQTIRDIQRKIERGEFLGPTIYSAGEAFISDRAVPPLSVAGVVDAVTKDKALGYTFIKIVSGVPSDVWDAVVATADKLGLRVMGHSPGGVGGLERALKARYLSIEHLDGFPLALARPGHPPMEFQGINLGPYLDESKMPALVDATRRAGVSVTPTQINYAHRFAEDEPEAMARRPEMKYVDPAQVKQWVESKKKDWATYSADTRTQFMAFRCRLIKALHDGGVRVMVGTDASMVPPQQWNVHAFVTQRELGALAKCGLSHYDVLAMGTRNPAEFFGTIDRAGTVEKGKRADLLLLDADPLADIANTSKIAGVMIGGRWVARADIDRRLSAAVVH